MLKTEDILILYSAGISIEDMAVYLDFDSAKEFTDSFEQEMKSKLDFHLKTLKKKSLTESEITALKEEIERKRNSDERKLRPTYKKIVEYAFTLAPSTEIQKVLAIEESDLDALIQVFHPNESFKAFVERCHIETKIRIRKAQLEKGFNGNEKILIHLGETVLEQAKKKVEPQINLNISIAKLIEEARKEIELEKGKGYKIENSELKQLESSEESPRLFNGDPNEK